MDTIPVCRCGPPTTGLRFGHAASVRREFQSGGVSVIGIRFVPDEAPSTSATEIWIDDFEFETWVRSGRVGPATLVWAGPLSQGEWRPAEDLEIYHLFQPAAVEPPPPEEPASLVDRLMPAHGFSAVE